MAQRDGAYETFAGSPASHGILQPDLWNTQTVDELDWQALRDLARAGLRNSLLVAPMPTASTSQILGYNECIEPFFSVIGTRRTLAGEFVIINEYMVRRLLELGLWDDTMKTRIMLARGSIQGITEIPEDTRELFKTAFEIKQKVIIDLAADRGAYICQSQSLNVFVTKPSFALLNNIHMYGWKKGLKTGTYYIRSKPASSAQHFTIDPKVQQACESCSA